MESLINFICEHAQDAHWIFFLLLMLAGLNVPISEDITLLVGGMIAATCVPEHWLKLFVWIWLGCYFSAWEAYWIGRLLGPKLYSIRWFSHVITKKRIDKINHYYEKFGLLTFIVGRFCPGGVRNCLFMTAGLGQMAFNKFALRDAVACFISSNVLFHLGYQFAERRDLLLHYFHTYQHIVFFTMAVILALLFTYLWMKNRKKEPI